MPQVFHLRRKSDGQDLQSWPAIPPRIEHSDGDVFLRVDGVSEGWEDNLFEIVSDIVADPVAEPVTITIFDGADFLSRLTDEEYGAILEAAKTSVQLARWLDIFRLRGEIDVTSVTAQAAKAGLVASNLLTQERANIVFASG